MDRLEQHSGNCLEVDGIVSYSGNGTCYPIIGFKIDFDVNNPLELDKSAQYWGNPDKARIHDLRYSMEYHGI